MSLPLGPDVSFDANVNSYEFLGSHADRMSLAGLF